MPIGKSSKEGIVVVGDEGKGFRGTKEVVVGEELTELSEVKNNKATVVKTVANIKGIIIKKYFFKK